MYAGVATMTSDSLKGLIRLAGAHVYVNRNDTFYANSRTIVLQTNRRSGRTRTIRLPRRTNVYDLLNSGGRIAASAREFTIAVRPKTTYAFFLGSRSPEL